MKFKLDENVPVDLFLDLRGHGTKRIAVHDEGIAGAPDSTVLERARAEGRVFFTLEKESQMFADSRLASRRG